MPPPEEKTGRRLRRRLRRQSLRLRPIQAIAATMALLEFVGLFPEVIYSIPDPKRRTILGSCFAPVVEPRRRNIRVAEPLLDLSDIGLMRQRIGGGSGTQRMDAEAVHFGADAGFQSVLSHNI